MSTPKQQTEIGAYGEALVRRYLKDHVITSRYEPELTSTNKRVDFVLSTTDEKLVYLEVKTMHVPPPVRSGGFYFDPYIPVRSHIVEGMKKFRGLPDTLNVIALVAFPGSLVDLREPRIMLGSMYGNAGFQIPFNVETGQGNSDEMTQVFVRKEGLMLRPGDLHRNSRLAAVISVHNPDMFFPDIPETGLPLGSYCQALMERLQRSDTPRPYVTVWENAIAKQQLPSCIFNGPGDARWGYDGDGQIQTFVGTERRVKQQQAMKQGRTAY